MAWSLGCNGHVVLLKVLRGVMRVGRGTMMSDRARVIGAALRGELMALDQKAFMTSSSVQPFTRTDTLSIAACRALCTASTPPYHQCAVGPTTVSST